MPGMFTSSVVISGLCLRTASTPSVPFSVTTVVKPDCVSTMSMRSRTSGSSSMMTATHWLPGSMVRMLTTPGGSPARRGSQLHRSFVPELPGRRATVALAVALARWLDPHERVEVGGRGRGRGFGTEGTTGRVAPVLARAEPVASGVDDVVRAAEQRAQLLAVRLLVVVGLEVRDVGGEATYVGDAGVLQQRSELAGVVPVGVPAVDVRRHARLGE